LANDIFFFLPLFTALLFSVQSSPSVCSASHPPQRTEWMKYLPWETDITAETQKKTETVRFAFKRGAIFSNKRIRVARFFLVQTFQIGKNATNDHKLYQTAINYTKWP
jgi:hypothetical protein